MVVVFFTWKVILFWALFFNTFLLSLDFCCLFSLVHQSGLILRLGACVMLFCLFACLAACLPAWLAVPVCLICLFVCDFAYSFKYHERGGQFSIRANSREGDPPPVDASDPGGLEERLGGRSVGPVHGPSLQSGVFPRHGTAIIQ